MVSKEHKGTGSSNSHGSRDIHVLDMCCGVGMSTRALQSTFYNNNNTIPSKTIIHGIDTSPEMIEFARFMTKHDADLSKVLQEKNVKSIHDLVLCKETLRVLNETYYHNLGTEIDNDILSFSNLCSFV